jgi:hypothetical protein
MKKTRGRKSRDTVPLSSEVSIILPASVAESEPRSEPQATTSFLLLPEPHQNVEMLEFWIIEAKEKWSEPEPPQYDAASLQSSQVFRFSP